MPGYLFQPIGRIEPITIQTVDTGIAHQDPPSTNDDEETRDEATEQAQLGFLGLISHFEGRGYSNVARVLTDIFNRQASNGTNPNGSNTETPDRTRSQTAQPPPTYHEIETRSRQTNGIESNTECVLREIYNISTWNNMNETLHNVNESETNNRSRFRPPAGSRLDFRQIGPRDQVQPTSAIREIEPRDQGSDGTEQSWASYFNTANRLRDLINDTRTTRNEENVNYRNTNANDVNININDENTIVNNVDTPTRHHHRPRTPPPAYHEVESSAVRIPRTDSLPSYDEFMMMPHLYVT